MYLDLQVKLPSSASTTCLHYFLLLTNQRVIKLFHIYWVEFAQQPEKKHRFGQSEIKLSSLKYSQCSLCIIYVLFSFGYYVNYLFSFPPSLPTYTFYFLSYFVCLFVSLFLCFFLSSFFLFSFFYFIFYQYSIIYLLYLSSRGGLEAEQWTDNRTLFILVGSNPARRQKDFRSNSIVRLSFLLQQRQMPVTGKISYRRLLMQN